MTIERSEVEPNQGAGYLVLVEYVGDLPTNQPLGNPPAGFIGSSGWLGVGANEVSLRLVHFENQAAAGEFLRERIENSEEPPTTFDIPPTIHHLTIQRHLGKTLEQMDVGSYLTALHAVAAPGYGDVAAQNIEDTLESLQLVEGYAGHVQGVNVALPDEVWAIVLWNSPPLLPAPPAADEAQVEHYRRVA